MERPQRFQGWVCSLLRVKAKACLVKTARIKVEIMGDQFGWTALDRALKTELLDTHGQTFVSESIIPGFDNSDNASQFRAIGLPGIGLVGHDRSLYK